jgi:hypothetical protein
MFTPLKRVLLAATFASLSLLVAVPVLADANAFSWTDLSNQLTTTANRPVWAMAYASGNWFYTDGQNLWNGGQVYRYDGATQVNITTDVRNAGLNQADDIVSDGQSVLYLQNMAARNNQFTAIEYTNGSYVNVTSALRNAFNSNEGISNIAGRNGEWYITTSQGRVLHWYGNNSTPTLVNLPSNLQVNVNNLFSLMAQGRTGNSLMYATGLPYKDPTFRVLPISGNEWLFVFGQNISVSGYSVAAQMFRLSNGSFSDLSTYLASSNNINAFSNGSSALILETNNSNYSSGNYLIVDGANAQSYTTNFSLPQGATALWTGQSWMIFGGTNKHVLHIVSGFSEDLGEARDYFVTGASNSQNAVLLGGAVSVLGNSQPTNPLTSKLVKVLDNGTTGTGTTNNTSTGFGGGRTTTSSNGPTIVTSGNPSNFTIGNNGTFDYLVNASDSNGVNHIDLYVNGGLIKTCYASSCEYDQTYSSNGLSTRSIPFYAVATDNYGYTTNGSSNQDVLTVSQNTSASAGNNSANAQTQNGISFWTWLDPNQTNIGQNQFMNFYVGTWSQQGINTVQIYVNGNVKQTCNLNNATGNQQCSVSLYGGDYGLNTTVSINAKITDGNGQVAWTPVQNLYVVTNGSTGTTTSNPSDISTWFTLNPTGSTLNRNSSVTMNVSGSANQGLSTINVYANGGLIRTCNFSQAYGTQTCTATVYGSNYSSGSQLTLNTQATDVNGMTAWSNSQVLTVQDNGTTNGNGNASSWVSSSPDTTTLTQGQSATFTVNASAPQGLQRIDVYVNGSIANTCNYGNTYSTMQCSTVITANSYANGSNVYVNAKITDSSGNTSWSGSRNYTVTSSNNSNQNGTNTNTNGSTWVWSSPETSTLSQGQSATFSVGANDPDGIQRLDIIANGVTVNTCNLGNAYGNQQCSTTISANNYTVGTSVFVNAKMTDAYGNITWSGSRNYTITSNGSTQTTQTSTNNAPPSTWIWSTPDQSQYAPGSTATFYVGTWSQNGIQKIEIYANGSIVQTCNLGAAYGNQQCSYNVTANAGTTSVYVNAKVTDTQNNISWSAAKTYTFTGTGTTNNGSSNFPSQLPGSIQISTNRTSGYGSNDTITFTANGSSQAGVDHIDIMVNAIKVQTCTNATTCSYTGGPYGSRSSVSYGAALVDKNGFTQWTGYTPVFHY